VGFTGTPILNHDKKTTAEIFGDFIDRYLLQDAELDGATVPILYEGRTTDGFVKDATRLDQLFIDMFVDYTPQDLAIIKARYGTKEKQQALIERFKRRWAPEKTTKTDPLAILVVNNMLLTGFDAPVEQMMYLDRKIVSHDLLQAIARVNRTYGGKHCGFVVDYIGVARHLDEALKEYDGADITGALIDIGVELPKLLDRRARAVAVFRSRDVGDLFTQVYQCVELLADLGIRAEFINSLRLFYETLNVLEHRPEVPGDVFRDAKLLGFINKVAANLYRDPALRCGRIDTRQHGVSQ
jgi:hypothetical protein